MNKVKFELRRQLARRHPRNKIGGSEEAELMNIPALKRLHVFADTETFYCTNGVKPGEHMGKKSISHILGEMDVLPFIVTGQFRRHKGSKQHSIYESGGVYDRCVYVDDLSRIESLLIDLSYIFNDGGFVPVLTFHNASYDLSILEPIFRELDPTMTFYFYTTDKRGFRNGCMQSEKYNFFCEFYDSLKYDRNMSIAKAGKILGYPKIEGTPYEICDVGLDDDDNIFYYDLSTGERRTFPLEKYMEYARRDVEIMRRYVERLERQNHLVNEIMVEDGTKMDQKKFNKKCSTRPSHAKQICNRYLEMKGGSVIDDVFRFEITEQLCNNTTELYKQTIESNNGGFTSTNKTIFKHDCTEDRIIRYFDRNSMYPTIMTGKLPYGTLLREHQKPDDCTTGYVIKLIKCEGKGVMSCLKTRPFGKKKINERRTFFVEKEYFDFVRENADVEYELIDTGYQANTTVIKHLIEMFYNRRKECNAKKQELEDRGDTKSSTYEDLDDQQKGLKLLMNSLYGKMCEKGHHTSVVYYQSKYTKFKQDNAKLPCILTGSFITYRGRLSLLQKIKAVIEAGHDFLYADTDSVVLGCHKDADMTPIFGTDQGNLGEGKQEGGYDLYLNIGLKKKYILINRRDTSVKPKFALSGIEVKYQEILKEQLKKNPQKTIPALIYMFDPKNNVLIEKCKRVTVTTLAYNQPVLYTTRFQMNPDMKNHTAIMKFTKDDFTLEICT